MPCTGKIAEAYELRRQLPEGCDEIAEIWSEIRDQLAVLPTRAAIPAEAWDEILGNVVTLEPLYQSMVTHPVRGGRPHRVPAAQQGHRALRLVHPHLPGAGRPPAEGTKADRRASS
ncbi:MAG: hypothetical protein U0800_26605 [Isosphaeraceae bacterium]